MSNELDNYQTVMLFTILPFAHNMCLFYSFLFLLSNFDPLAF